MKTSTKWALWLIWGAQAVFLVATAKNWGSLALGLLGVSVVIGITGFAINAIYKGFLVTLRDFVYSYTTIFTFFHYCLVFVVFAWVLKLAGLVDGSWHDQLYLQGLYPQYWVILSITRALYFWVGIEASMWIDAYLHRIGWYWENPSQPYSRDREQDPKSWIVWAVIFSLTLLAAFGEMIIRLCTWNIPIYLG